MDRQYFIANLKSHFTTPEIDNYLSQLQNNIQSVDLEKNVIILCPSFTLLDFVSRKVRELNIPVSIGAQNVSAFEEGAYTGEVYAMQVKEFAEFVIIGHSERKRYNHESDEDVMRKAELASAAGLRIIQCIQDENSQISNFAEIVAYEPPSAISTFGTGIPDAPGDVQSVLENVDTKAPGKILVYGGSVNMDTIGNYASIEKCSGFLVGSASLKAFEFLTLITSC